ncbi:Dynamin central region-domain-containing protein [Mycena amicta]|nr:Dynamin central region-domain-containing protein [Mycena amicta]
MATNPAALAATPSESEKRAATVILTAITEFTNQFRLAIEARDFHELYDPCFIDLDPLERISDSDIRSILYSVSGSPAAGIEPSFQAFEVIVKYRLRRLEEPSLKCCQLAHDELLQIFSETLDKLPILVEHPVISQRFSPIAFGPFEKWMESTKKLVCDIVAMQASCVDSRHPDFIGTDKAIANVKQRMMDPSGHITDSGSSGILEQETTKLLLTSYFNIVRREMAHVVPKTIFFLFLRRAKEDLQRELLEGLYTPDVIAAVSDGMTRT